MATKKLQILESLVTTDSTLTQENKPADAKAVGEITSMIEKLVPSYASKHTAPNDLLNVYLDCDYTQDCMQPSQVATEDASTLVNSPLASGAFYAFRTVESYNVGHVCVRLHEMYPNNGRVWSNMYDKNQQNWMGWKTNEVSGSYAPAGYIAQVYDVATNEALDNAIQDAFSSMTYRTKKHITIVVSAGDLSLDGGDWHIELYRAWGDYGYCEAKKYGSNNMPHLVRSMVNGTWGAWVRCDPSAFALASHHHYGTHPFVEFSSPSTNAFPEYGMLISRAANSYGTSTGDNYYIGLNSHRNLKVGTQVNGATNITWDIVLTQTLPSSAYGTSLPAAGTKGRIFFKKA